MQMKALLSSSVLLLMLWRQFTVKETGFRITTGTGLVACVCIYSQWFTWREIDAQLRCTEPGLDTGESALSTCIPIFLFPDCRGNATSCLLFLPPCLPSHEGLGPHLVKQTTFFYRLFFRHYLTAVREVTNTRKSPIVWLCSLSRVS